MVTGTCERLMSACETLPSSAPATTPVTARTDHEQIGDERLSRRGTKGFIGLLAAIRGEHGGLHGNLLEIRNGRSGTRCNADR
jgi:hypothetical protein